MAGSTTVGETPRAKKKKFRHDFNHYNNTDTKGYLVYLGQFSRHPQLLVLGAHHILKKSRGLEITYYPKDYTKHAFLPKHEFKRGRLEIYWRLTGASREITVWWSRPKPYEPQPLPWYFAPSAALILVATFLLCNLHHASSLLYIPLFTGTIAAAAASYRYLLHNQPPNYDEE